MAFVLRSLGRLTWPVRTTLHHLRSRATPDTCDSLYRLCCSPIVNTTRFLHSSQIRLMIDPNVSILADGKKFKVAWSEGKESTFHVAWLRHNCKCPECWDAYTCQTKVQVEHLRENMALKDATITDSPDGQRMTISWTYQEGGGEHTGFIDLSFLKENSYSSALVRQRAIDCRPLVTKTLPRVSYTEITGSDEGLWKWLRLVNEYGQCHVTDIPTTPGEIRKLAKLAGGLQETYLGEVGDVIAHPVPEDLAYSNGALPLHMDLSYFESTPGLLLLLCLKNDKCVEGGHSVLVDAFPVVEELRQKHPQHFETLTKVPATFQRIQFNRDDPVALVHRKPQIILDDGGNVTAIHWNPDAMGPLFTAEEDVEKYYEAYCCLGDMLANTEWKIAHGCRACMLQYGSNGEGLPCLPRYLDCCQWRRIAQVHHLLKPGDALTFNNRRMVHSRTEFKANGGERHLQAVFVNIDNFKSKVRVLATKYAPGYIVKAVLNQDAL